MEPQITFDRFWIVETDNGTECIPADLAGTRRELPQYLEGTRIISAKRKRGWFARLSMPGYLDCTPWSGPFTSEDEAREHLAEMYGDDD